MTSQPQDGEYVFDLQVNEPPTSSNEALGIHIYFIPSGEEEGETPEVVVSSNMPVADIERGLATSLEALDTWWQRDAHQFPEEVLGLRDLAFVNRIWTPFSEPEEQR
ncbi:hypothetical protein BH789_gp007 [Gordonia phage GMA6]|uniref:Uncharacterized protein n=1 Tax=Gordonia phage GMA6 TaxID=1647285 RepID=A0A0K0NL29_9CAUD|nr:hypothetical protein BH789_gp007 [Gordonia phage GMA6]AKL88288.1 hypothetical protein GMA6_7 [Gordonia phage GMA6]